MRERTATVIVGVSLGLISLIGMGVIIAHAITVINGSALAQVLSITH